MKELNEEAMRIYNNMNAYKHAYAMLCEAANERQEFLMPAHTLALRTCELYVKLLLWRETHTMPVENGLCMLYGRLSEKLQTRIVRLTEAFYQKSTQSELLFEQMLQDTGKDLIVPLEAEWMFMDSLVKALAMEIQLCL